MSDFGEQVRTDLLAMIEDDPTTFEFEGVEYRGTSSGLNRRSPLEIGGFEPAPELTIAINLRNSAGDEVFGQNRPQANGVITIEGVEYRIDRTEIDSFQESLQMDLRSPDK